MEPKKYIVSIDLGDGESSIAYALTEGKEEPQVAKLKNGEKSMITAIARQNGKTLIGEEALLAERTFENALNIKDAPTKVDSEVWDTSGNSLKRFAEVLCKKYFEPSYPEIYGNAKVYIGHPSGWSPADIKLYEELFASTKVIPDVTIKSESRAAFIQVRDYRGLSSDQLKSVLVIDIGSSTTDFTFVKDLEAVELPIGSQFGARLIDCLIYNYVKEQCLEREELIERLQTRARNKAFLLYLCRKAKERCFSDKAAYKPERPDLDKDLAWIFDRCWPLLEELDMNKMEALLKQPIVGSEIEEILDRSMESFPKGWKESFKDLLHLIKRDNLETLEPKVVLLTGGGSRMKFTEEICREVFCSATINPDKEPFFSVAKGLAGFGRWEYRVEKFHEEVNVFCGSEGLKEVINKDIDSFAKDVRKLLYQKSCDLVWRPMLLELRDGTLTADEICDLTTYMYKRLNEYLQTDESQNCQEAVIRNYLNHIEPYINGKTDKICDKFAIEKKSLNLEVELSSNDFFGERSFLSESVYNLEMICAKPIIKVTGKVIPVKFRQKVPEAVVNWFGDVTELSASASTPFIRFVPISQKTKEKFAKSIHEQISKQLHKRADEVEKYIR